MQAKIVLMRMSALLLVFGLSQAATAFVETDDAVTRTFDIFVVSEFDFANGGTGIYSSSGPCPLVVFGLRPNIPSATYYEHGRVRTNVKTVATQLFAGQSIPLGSNPCPIPGSGGATDLQFTVPPTTFYGPYDGVVIDQLICGAGNTASPLAAVDCFPDSDNSTATVARCNAGDADFVGSPADGRSVFADVATGSLQPLAGSWSISCTNPDGTDAFRDPITYYSNSPTNACSSWFFDSNDWGTDSCAIPIENTVPLDNGVDDTGYLVTCMHSTALVVDPTKSPSTYMRTFDSHDYILVLDLDGSPGSWTAALQEHMDGTPSLQGVHDLSGKNGFACANSRLVCERLVAAIANVWYACPTPAGVQCNSGDRVIVSVVANAGGPLDIFNFPLVQGNVVCGGSSALTCGGPIFCTKSTRAAATVAPQCSGKVDRDTDLIIKCKISS